MSLLHPISDRPDEAIFWCPGCATHHLVDARWTVTGPADAPTVWPSILLKGGEPRCHLFVDAGHIRYLSDSTHELAGQTVPMEDVDR